MSAITYATMLLPLSQRILEEWPNRRPNVRLAIDDIGFVDAAGQRDPNQEPPVPKITTPALQESTSYVQARVQVVGTDKSSGGWSDASGAIVAAIYTPYGIGKGLALAIAQDWTDMLAGFRWASGNGYVADVGEPELIGHDVDRGLYQVNSRSRWIYQQAVA